MGYKAEEDCNIKRLVPELGLMSSIVYLLFWHKYKPNCRSFFNSSSHCNIRSTSKVLTVLLEVY